MSLEVFTAVRISNVVFRVLLHVGRVAEDGSDRFLGHVGNTYNTTRR
jgi:hypothetical protein